MCREKMFWQRTWCWQCLLSSWLDENQDRMWVNRKERIETKAKTCCTLFTLFLCLLHHHHLTLSLREENRKFVILILITLSLDLMTVFLEGKMICLLSLWSHYFLLFTSQDLLERSQDLIRTKSSWSISNNININNWSEGEDNTIILLFTSVLGLVHHPSQW